MRTAEYKASCEPLISYVRGTVLEAFLLHGASPKHTTQRNVGESHITANTLSVLDSINASIIQNPENYLYIRALHPDVASKLPADAKAKALDALKNGAAPKIGSTYTERAVKLLAELAQEFVKDPSLFLKTSLHPDSIHLIEQDLGNLGSNLETIKSQAYQNLTHQAVDPKLADGYTDNGANAIERLAEELKANPTLLLYYTLHNNTTLEVAKALQDLGVTLKEVGAQARGALENGASPVEAVDGEYTANAKAALERIASNIKTDPMKFLYVTLHNDSISEISAWLDAHESSVGAIKAQANAGLKAGKPITVSDNITSNAIEAMTVLADELKADPKLWLHISLNDDVMAPLSEALVKTESSLDAIKKAAVDMLKDGENSQTNNGYTDNSLEALATLKSELQTDSKLWLYIKLDRATETQMISNLGLDLAQIKTGAIHHISHGGGLKLDGKLVTPNATSLIAELASKYISDKKVPSDHFFHPDMKEQFTLYFTQNKHPELVSQLKLESGAPLTWYETVFGKAASAAPAPTEDAADDIVVVGGDSFEKKLALLDEEG